jgi:hypothetical protein
MRAERRCDADAAVVGGMAGGVWYFVLFYSLATLHTTLLKEEKNG